jgi:hypothetical protein
MTKLKLTGKGTSLPNQLAALEQRLGPIETRAIDSLKTFENNPRKHPEGQLTKLAASIEQFGFTMPVLVDEDGSIIAGEARVTAAKRLGIREVPVLVAHHWSAAQVRAYRLADNRLAVLATWDEEALSLELAAIVEFDEVPIEILGWETAEIDLILDCDRPTKSTDPADEQIELPTNPVSREGDLWVLGQHRLLCGSSLDAASWASLLQDEVAAMTFTDPPYNVPISGHVCGLGKASHAEFAMASGEMSKAEFTGFLTDFIARLVPH